jgi:hypothetical protein
VQRGRSPERCVRRIASNPSVSANKTARESGLIYWWSKKGEKPW